MMNSRGVKKLAMPGVSVIVGAAFASGVPSGKRPADITNTNTHITPYCRQILASRIPRGEGSKAYATPTPYNLLSPRAVGLTQGADREPPQNFASQTLRSAGRGTSPGSGDGGRARAGSGGR